VEGGREIYKTREQTWSENKGGADWEKEKEGG
jgi:hypothetical protein